jgi:glycosyltransferase involved in cell wall biosynthesis
MSDSFPYVSVVMPVYNGGKYLREAIESILAQTFQNFELIVVDDGSTDCSPSILGGYGQKDERIVILTHSMNQGIAMALNRGLKIARGKYIARMDADDVSLPERIEKQVDFLDAHLDVGILGCDAIFMDSQGKDVVTLSHPRDDLSLRWMGLVANVFFHPTVMIRRAVLTGFNLDYQADYEPVEDYDLWLRILEHSQGANLDQSLVRYRVYAESISSRHKLEGAAKHVQTSYANIRRMYPEIQISRDEHAALVAAVTGNLTPSLYRLRPALARRYLEL